MGFDIERSQGLRCIVCDTGPLLCLSETQLLPLLRLAGELYIPPAVGLELRSIDPLPDWIRLSSLNEGAATDARSWERAGLLDIGEAQALALARQLKAEWFLTDDAAARWVGQREGLEVHGSLGVVLWGAATGHLDMSAARAALERLANSSLWLSERVLREARSTLDFLFSKTTPD